MAEIVDWYLASESVSKITKIPAYFSVYQDCIFLLARTDIQYLAKAKEIEALF